jgi:hypothetical protein
VIWGTLGALYSICSETLFLATYLLTAQEPSVDLPAGICVDPSLRSKEIGRNPVGFGMVVGLASHPEYL